VATSIPIEEKRTKTDTKRVRKHTEEGDKDFIIEARTSEWVDPDDDARVPDNEFKYLPGIEDVDLT
jgi:hypothetical protein